MDEASTHVPLGTVVSVLEDLLSNSRSKIVQCAAGVFETPKLDAGASSKLLGAPSSLRSRSSSVFSPLSADKSPPSGLGSGLGLGLGIGSPNASAGSEAAANESPEFSFPKKSGSKFAWFDELNAKVGSVIKGFEDIVVVQVKESVSSQAFKDKAASTLRQQLYTANQQVEQMKKQLEDKSDRLESVQKTQLSQQSAQYAEVVQLKDSLKIYQNKEQVASMSAESFRKKVAQLEETLEKKNAEFQLLDAKHHHVSSLYHKLKEQSDDERTVAHRKIADLEAKVRYLNKAEGTPRSPSNDHLKADQGSPKSKPLLEFTRQERAELIKSYEEKMQSLKTDMEAKISAFKRASHSRVAELKKEHEAFMDEVLQNHQREVQKMEAEMEAKLENEKTASSQLESRLQDEFARQRLTLQERIANLEEEISRENEVWKARELMLKTKVDSLEADVRKLSERSRGLEQELSRSSNMDPNGVSSIAATPSSSFYAEKPGEKASLDSADPSSSSGPSSLKYVLQAMQMDSSPRRAESEKSVGDDDLDVGTIVKSTAENTPRDSIRSRRLDDLLPPKSPLRAALDLAMADVSALREREQLKAAMASATARSLRRSRDTGRSAGTDDVAESMVKDFLIEQLEKALDGSHKQVGVLRSQLSAAEAKIESLNASIQTMLEQSKQSKIQTASVFTQTDMKLALSRQNSYRVPVSSTLPSVAHQLSALPVATLGGTVLNALSVSGLTGKQSPTCAFSDDIDEDAYIENKAAEIERQQQSRMLEKPAVLDKVTLSAELAGDRGSPVDNDGSSPNPLRRQPSRSALHKKSRSATDTDDGEQSPTKVSSKSIFQPVKSEDSPFVKDTVLFSTFSSPSAGSPQFSPPAAERSNNLLRMEALNEQAGSLSFAVPLSERTNHTPIRTRAEEESALQALVDQSLNLHGSSRNQHARIQDEETRLFAQARNSQSPGLPKSAKQAHHVTIAPSPEPSNASPAKLSSALVFRSLQQTRSPMENSVLARRLPREATETSDTDHVPDSAASSADRPAGRSGKSVGSGILMTASHFAEADSDGDGSADDKQEMRRQYAAQDDLEDHLTGDNSSKKKGKRRKKSKRRLSSALGYPSKLPQEASLERQNHRPQTVMEGTSRYASSPHQLDMNVRSSTPSGVRPQSRSFSPLRNLVHSAGPGPGPGASATSPQNATYGPRAFQMHEIKRRVVADVLAQRQMASTGGPISDSFVIVPRDFVNLDGHTLAKSAAVGKRLGRF
eukprot:ANDGO_06918.mRNA.1 hypothetical protein